MGPCGPADGGGRRRRDGRGGARRGAVERPPGGDRRRPSRSAAWPASRTRSGSPTRRASTAPRRTSTTSTPRAGSTGTSSSSWPSSTTSPAASEDVEEARSLVEEKHVFAVLPVVTQIFAAGPYLASKGVPTFGWNINAEWADGPNLFGEKGSYLCFTCPSLAPACRRPPGRGAHRRDPRVHRVVVGAVRGRDRSRLQGVRLRCRVRGHSLAFGFTDLGSDIDAMKSKGVQFVATCMDISGVINAAQAMRTRRAQRREVLRAPGLRPADAREVRQRAQQRVLPHRLLAVRARQGVQDASSCSSRR